MNYLQIEEEIAKNQLVLLSGEEKFLMEEIATTFAKRWVPQNLVDFNVVYIKGEATEDKVLDALVTLPLMSPRKLVVIQDIEEFTNGKNLSKEFFNNLEKIQEGTVLLCLESKKALDKRTKVYKSIQKHGKVIPCNPLQARELLQFLQKQDPEKREIAYGVFQYFIDLMGYLQNNASLLEVKLEWEKILQACSGRPVEKADVDYFISYEKEKSIFALTDAFVAKNVKKTFEAIKSLKDQNIDSYQIVGLLNRQVENLYRAKILLDQGYQEQAIRQRMGVHPFVAKKLCQEVGRFSLKELKNMLDALINLDQDLKSLSIPDQYLVEVKILEMMSQK